MKTTRLTPGSACFKVIASLLIVFTVLGHSFSQECINCNPDSLSGLYPSVMGGNTQALGDYSFAGGYFSTVNGPLSFAFGNRVSVDGAYSVGIGKFVGTAGTSAMVLGSGFNINNPLINDFDDSFMIGFGSTKPTLFVGRSTGVNNTGNVGIATTDPQAKLHVNGDFQVGDAENPQEIRLHGSVNSQSISAYTFGDGSTTGSNYSFIAGRNSIIHPGNPHGNIIGSESTINGGFHSIVVGSNSQATNDFSFVFGPYSKSKGTMSFAIGSHVEAWSGGSFIIGNGKDTTKFINTIPNSLMVGFGSTLPTLFVEKAPYSYDNDRTGQIGIGNITSPQAKLHIRADAQEDATLRLEATGSGKHARMYFTGEHHITAGNDDDFRFRTSDGRNFIFQNGDIYMEDINFGIIMKSPNGHCWRGVMTDNGTLSFSQANCPGEASSVQNLPVEEGKLKAWPNPTNGNLIIESELYGSSTELLISAMEGNMILRQMIISARTEVSLKSFAPGTYILQLLSNGQLVESRKVVKN